MTIVVLLAVPIVISASVAGAILATESILSCRGLPLLPLWGRALLCRLGKSLGFGPLRFRALRLALRRSLLFLRAPLWLLCGRLR